MLDLNNGRYYQHNHMEPFSGTAYEEYPNGQKKMVIPVKNGKIDGMAREWAPNGQMMLEVTYVDGLKEGMETQWFPQGGKRLEIKNVADKPNGMCYEWHRNGILRSEGLYQNGKETGTHQWYYDNGALDQVVPFTDGQPEGQVKTYYQNGQLKSEASFSEGVMNGSKNEYYSNGILRSSFSFLNGKEHGEGTIHGKDGRLLERYQYDNGQQLLHQDYHSGSVRSKEGYYQVYNEPGGYCQLSVTGQEVLPRGTEEVIYIVDGMILQIISTTTSKMTTLPSDTASENILKSYILQETDYIGRSLGTDLQVRDSAFTNPQKVKGVHWNFRSPLPSDEELTARTIIEEHYLTFLCGNRLVSLYAPITRSDKPDLVLEMLTRIGNSVICSSSPIDLNTLVTAGGE